MLYVAYAMRTHIRLCGCERVRSARPRNCFFISFLCKNVRRSAAFVRKSLRGGELTACTMERCSESCLRASRRTGLACRLFSLL